jgi:hypothetical protein
MGELANHMRFVERSSRKLARSTFYGMTRWQAKMERKQAFLGRIVDIGAELFAIASAVVYADTIRHERPDRADSAQELADLFCKQARRRVDTLFTALWANDDDLNYKAALDVMDGRHTWIEEGIVDPAGDEGATVTGQPEGVEEAKDRESETAGSSNGSTEDAKGNAEEASNGAAAEQGAPEGDAPPVSTKVQ